MAPNLKQLTFLSDSLADIGHLVRSKVPAAAPAPQPLASYWDWPTEDEACVADLFSADHVQANLMQESSSKVSSSSSGLVAEHDDYWAEESSVAQPLHQQQQQQAIVSADYWNEASHDACCAADAYWNERVRPTHYHGPSAAQYWNEATHGRTAADDYWNDNTAAAAQPMMYYWQEACHGASASDRYWSMVAR